MNENHLDKLKPKIKVLIVEDDFVNALVLTKYLEKDFVLKHVTNGYDAIKTMQQEKFDVILMDINLGDETLDGIEATKRIREFVPKEQTSIFAVTAYTGEDFRRKVQHNGFDAYYAKPINKEIIITAIQNSLH